MSEYNAPFRYKHLLGVFRWTPELTDEMAVGSNRIYHACHATQLQAFLRADELFLRSHYDFKRPGGSNVHARDCNYFSLHDWHNMCRPTYFGPFLIGFPMKVLEGRRFYVFQRDCNGRKHIYFVQRQNPARRLFGDIYGAKGIDPLDLFTYEKGMGYELDDDVRYEMLLSEALPLRRARIIGVEHGCPRRECGGLTRADARRKLQKIAMGQITDVVNRFPDLKLLPMFRDLATA